MKTLKYILVPAMLALFAAGLGTSCSKFLEENPRSVNTKNNYFTDGTRLKAGVVGMYKGLINLYVINTNTPIFLFMTGTDELCYRASNTNVRSTVDRYTYTATEGCVQELWGRLYTIIGRTNVIIDAALSLDNISEQTRNSTVAEARFLRAWCYFQLVQFYGDLPLQLAETTEFDFTVPRSPLRDVYAAIIDDLDFASAPGSLPTGIRDGHANYWAVRTLLGKVYLTMASAKEAARVAGYADLDLSVQELYRQAHNVLRDVKDNSGRDLLPVYRDVFEINNKNVNQESIWELQFSAEQPYGTQWAKEMGMTNKGYASTNGGWRFCPEGGQYNLNSVPSFRGYYKSQDYDVRRNYNIADSIIIYNGTSGAPMSMNHISTETGVGTDLLNDGNSSLVTRSSATKYRWGKNYRNDYPIPYIYSNCPNNIIALRFADVLLMFAEADMKLGGGTVTPEGLAAVNRVVQRARGVNAGGAPVTEAETPGFANYTASTLTFEELMKERARELCFEFWRRHDLVRTGMMEHFLSSRNATTNIKTQFDPDKHYLLPVPQYEIDNSQNKEGMYQNPNY